MTKARNSTFERMKQLCADSVAAKHTLKDQKVEKNEEEQQSKQCPAPSAPKEKKQYCICIYKPHAP